MNELFLLKPNLEVTKSGLNILGLGAVIVWCTYCLWNGYQNKRKENLLRKVNSFCWLWKS